MDFWGVLFDGKVRSGKKRRRLRSKVPRFEAFLHGFEDGLLLKAHLHFQAPEMALEGLSLKRLKQTSTIKKTIHLHGETIQKNVECRF